MRSRSVRLTIVILLILGLALAALGFRSINIDLPGLPALERDGAGPLGLKLGLDLSGGGHLVYQADTGSRFDVTLLEQADLEKIAESLSGFRFGDEELPLEDFQVFPRDVDFIQREVITTSAVVVEGEEPSAEGEESVSGETEGEGAEGEEQVEEPEEPQMETIAVASVFEIRTQSRMRWGRWTCSR